MTPGADVETASVAGLLPDVVLDGAELLERTASSTTYLWKGTIDQSSRVPAAPSILSLPQLLVGRPGPLANPSVGLPFDAPVGVPFFVNASLTWDGESGLGLVVLGNGTTQCQSGGIGVRGQGEGIAECQTRLYDPLDEPEAWSLVVAAFANDQEALPFEVRVRIETAPIPATIPAPTLVAHKASGSVEVPAEFRTLAFEIKDTGMLGVAEPTIGVTSDGTIFTTATAQRVNPAVQGVPAPALRQLGVARSRDNGATWEVVGHPILGPKVSLDPWLWVDPITDRLYDAPLYVECSWAHWTDDGGQVWDANPFAGCGLPDHDHQKITTGPPVEGVTTVGYPNVVYYSYNPFRGVPERAGTYVTTSLDGGRTWSVGAETIPRDCTGGISGGVAVAPDGTAYSSHGGCEGVFVAISKDSGETWSAPVRAASHHLQFGNPDIGFDRDGVAYLAHSDERLGVSVTISRDGGATWQPEVDITHPSIGRAMFPFIAVGEPGKVAVSYLATTADPSAWPRGGDPSYSPDATVWHSYVTYSLDALSDDPTWVTVRVTPDDDPVQIGCIWSHGGSHECRNLLDFIDNTQHEGRVYTARADGCDRCTEAARPQVRGSSVVEIQVAGPTLGPAWWAEEGSSGTLPLGLRAPGLARP